MLPAEYYSIIYILLVIIMSLPFLRRVSSPAYAYGKHNENYSTVVAYWVCIVIVLFVGYRPNSVVFNDGPGYWYAMVNHRWENYIEGNFWGHTGTEADNYFIFARLMALMSSHGVSPRQCFIVLSVIVYGFAFFALKKAVPKEVSLAFLLFCGTFGTLGFATNGIKNGCAMSFFLCALAYRDNWKMCSLFLLLALGFHHSMSLSIGAFIVCLFYKNTRVFFAIWLCSLLAAAAHITYFQYFFADFADDHAAGYLLGEGDFAYLTGFRIDFILYSAAPIVLGWWILIKKGIESEYYQFMLNVYLLMNSIWLLCMYVSFTNRIAQLSWSLFPMLIMYPLTQLKISENQNKVLKWFVVGQLSFTLLMAVLYIGRV